MKPVLQLRVLTPADLDFADGLRAASGWNQTRADWQRFLATEPDGCFIAECDGQPAGTATTTVYGHDLAWIGMMLVHPEYRRRGVGTALLTRCLEGLRGRGVRCIKLDATPLGERLYRRFGFDAEWTLQRWEGNAPAAGASLRSPNLRPWTGRDFDAVVLLDRSAFGVARTRLLPLLAAASHRGLVHVAPGGELEGFGFIRVGARAAYLGPVVAGSSPAGVALVRQLFAESPARVVYWDVPDGNAAGVALARELGFAPQRPLVRMFLGENVHAGDPLRQFALAGPEVG
jgi:GNAT superfamily N-acetyltransferase